MQETAVFTYRMALPPTEWAKASGARQAAGDLWTSLVRIHRLCRRRHWRWPTASQLKAHFKRRFPLHSQTVQALIEKFCATIDGVRTKRQNGDKQARYPWRFRRYFNPIFKGQSLNFRSNICSCPGAGDSRKSGGARNPGRGGANASTALGAVSAKRSTG